MKRYLDQRLRFQSLRILDALEIHGSLLKASAALGVSQPALTKSIRDIEDIEALLPLLAAGQIDLITGRFYEPSVADGFEREELWQDPMALLARTGHPLLNLATITIDDIGRYELVLPSNPQRVAAEIDEIVEVLGLTETPTTRSTSYGFLREVLLASDAIAIMPPMLMLGDLNRGTMAARALPIELSTRSAGIITAKGRKLNPAAAAFVDCLRGHISEIVEQGIGGLATFASPPVRS